MFHFTSNGSKHITICGREKLFCSYTSDAKIVDCPECLKILNSIKTSPEVDLNIPMPPVKPPINSFGEHMKIEKLRAGTQIFCSVYSAHSSHKVNQQRVDHALEAMTDFFKFMDRELEI